MVSCPLCTKTFKCQTSFRHHMFSHTKEKPYNCRMCPAAFGREGNLNQHVKSVHDGIKQIKNKNSHCPLCTYKCYSKTMLESHMQKHSDELPFTCTFPDCGFKTKYKSGLYHHVRSIHSDERPFECPSDGCSYKAKYRAHLRSHLKTHNNEKPFVCKFPGCDYACKMKENFKVHTARHSDEKPFKCSHCDFGTKSRSNLTQHQRAHFKVKSYQCQAPNCNFASHVKAIVKRHFDAKHRKKGVPCTKSGCYLRFGSIALLKVHLNEHEKPMLTCPSCNFTTKFKRHLLKHITRKHKDPQPVSVVVEPRQSEIAEKAHAGDTLRCSFSNCGYQTQFPHLYDRHRVTHKKEGKRKQVCSFCFSRFTNLSQLKSHIQRHTGEKPLSCPLCTYKTGVGLDLRTHARSAHHIHVIPCREENLYEKTCGTCGRNCLSYSDFVIHSMSHLQPVVVLQRLHVHVE